MAQGKTNEKKRLVVEVDASLFKRIKIESAMRDTTMTDIVDRALSDWFERNAVEHSESEANQ